MATLILMMAMLIAPLVFIEGRLGDVERHNFGGLENGGIKECTAEQLRAVEGFFLDLDGTIYDAQGLLPGVEAFFKYLEESKTPYVLLSNGFKTREGVISKLAMGKFKIDQQIDVEKVHTAGISLSRYMTDNVPPGAKIFAIGTSIEYPDGSKDFLSRILQREVPSQLFDSWEVRTDLNMTDIHNWAHLSRDMDQPVYVVIAVMGNPNDKFGDDPVTHRSGYSTMDYNLMKKINVLLRNNAYFIVGAPDVADSQPKSDVYPNIDTAWPTMGGFEQFFMTSAEMFPGTEKEKKYHVNTGKGGNLGAKYMMEPGVELIMKQNPSIRRENIMMVGDNFGTDVKAGNEVGVQSMLVLVGAHQLSDAPNWTSRPTCYLRHVGRIPELLSPNTAAPAA